MSEGGTVSSVQDEITTGLGHLILIMSVYRHSVVGTLLNSTPHPGANSVAHPHL